MEDWFSNIADDDTLTKLIFDQSEIKQLHNVIM